LSRAGAGFIPIDAGFNDLALLMSIKFKALSPVSRWTGRLQINLRVTVILLALR